MLKCEGWRWFLLVQNLGFECHLHIIVIIFCCFYAYALFCGLCSRNRHCDSLVEEKVNDNV